MKLVLTPKDKIVPDQMPPVIDDMRVYKPEVQRAIMAILAAGGEAYFCFSDCFERLLCGNAGLHRLKNLQSYKQQ